MLKSTFNKKTYSACAVMLSLVLALFSVPLSPAHAETNIDIDAPADELQQQVEKSAKEYEEAAANLSKLEEEITENTERLTVIEEELPEQEEKSNEAVRALYMMQQDSSSFVNLILSSTSLSEFFVTLEYVTRLQDHNLREVMSLKELKEELETIQKDLAAKQKQAKEEKERAEKSLEDAMAARQAAQEKALEAARQQAAAMEAEQAAAVATSPEAPPAGNSGGGAVETPGGIDWPADKQAFVAEWEGRINAYLSGSPMTGQGRTFAEAAWNYGVDPRWSPAIANTESSKGRYCFLPHNAWGWGQISWSSWEEAIDAHVRGLARGYGYTISVAAAQKYCPPNWEHWYNSTLAQMNSI